MSLVGGENLIQSYPAVPASVPAARQEVTAFAARAGATGEQLDAIALAATEAITNVVVHAYRGEGGGRVHVNADIAEDELWLLIGDDGCGLRAGNDSPGLGVGLALIATSTDGLTIMNRGCGGTEVRMRFNLGATGYEDGDYSGESSRSASRPASSRFSTTK
ncbi:MAG: ATP-binding protein [Actinobacteria bacterium]|nr:ATP-binding protein [Actinomycetota bacterium]